MMVRPMQEADLIYVAALSDYLSYPTSTLSIESRFRAIASVAKYGCFVVQAEARAVIGWVHIYGVLLLESDGYAEVGGLVVQPESRRQGV